MKAVRFRLCSDRENAASGGLHSRKGMGFGVTERTRWEKSTSAGLATVRLANHINCTIAAE